MGEKLSRQTPSSLTVEEESAPPVDSTGSTFRTDGLLHKGMAGLHA